MQRIVQAEYEFPPHVKVSKACRDLLHKILTPDPAKRVTVPDIQNHVWYKKDLPRGVSDMNDNLLPPGAGCQVSFLFQRTQTHACMVCNSVIDVFASLDIRDICLQQLVACLACRYDWRCSFPGICPCYCCACLSYLGTSPTFGNVCRCWHVFSLNDVHFVAESVPVVSVHSPCQRSQDCLASLGGLMIMTCLRHGLRTSPSGHAAVHVQAIVCMCFRTCNYIPFELVCMTLQSLEEISRIVREAQTHPAGLAGSDDDEYIDDAMDAEQYESSFDEWGASI